MMAVISETLTEAGYQFIGMDHYVLPGDELAVAQGEGRLQRNFQGYSLQLAEDLLGLGVSAISQLGDFYLQNAAELPAYYLALDRGDLPIAKGYKMDAEDQLRRRIIMSLICDLTIDIAELEDEFNVDFTAHFANELSTLDTAFADGLLKVDRDFITVSEVGRPFLRNICMAFDAYLNVQKPQTRNQFSSTV